MLDLEQSVTRKRYRYIIPYVFLLYIIAFLDRVNLAYAGLQMNKALSFSPEVFGLGAGIFFLGYFILEIPSTLIIERWSARGWIARIMVSWGIVAVAMAFIHTPTSFYITRFLLGLAEAGFFPGIILYLSYWFRRDERAKAVAFFMTALPVSQIIGAPLSGFILQNVHALGMAGWQWVFILEGLPAIIVGIWNFYYMVDRPAQAPWLTQEEKTWLQGELDREAAETRSRKAYSLWQALALREVWVLAGVYFFWITGFYGFGLWLPQIIKKLSSQSSDLTVSLMSMIPYLFALAGMVWVGWSSDRSGERKKHASLAILFGAIGLFLSAIVTGQIWLSIVFFIVAAIGIYGAFGPFWAMPSAFLTDEAKAAAIGLINSIGNLGGFLGPYGVGYFKNATGSFFGGLMFLIVSLVIGSGMVFLLRQGVTVNKAVPAASSGD